VHPDVNQPCQCLYRFVVEELKEPLVFIIVGPEDFRQASDEGIPPQSTRAAHYCNIGSKNGLLESPSSLKPWTLGYVGKIYSREVEVLRPGKIQKKMAIQAPLKA
jgi:hypothetical protein